MSDADLRIGDREREQAAAELGEHYAQGRLDVDEHAERLDQIWAARTHRDLAPVFADLRPAPAAARFGTPSYAPRLGTGSRSPRRFRGVPFPLVLVFAILAVVTVATHLPLILIGVGVWFLLTRGGHCGSRRVHY